jgi:chemotaxis receptor (MCP) glutamine deamidase CheD
MLLGLPLSITPWHTGKGIAEMSGCGLARLGQHLVFELDRRYAAEATPLKLRDTRVNANSMQCEEILFGSGNRAPRDGPARLPTISKKDRECVLEPHAQDIRIISKSKSGEAHRRVMFNATNGHFWAHQVRPIEISKTKIRRTA